MTKQCCAKRTDGLESIDADIVTSTTIDAEDIVTNTLRANDYVSLPDGSAAQPALRFNTWPNSGIYYAGRTMTIVIGQAPVIQMGFDSGQIFNFLPTVIPVGNAGTPSLTFSGDADTGLYRQNANQIGLTTGGINRLSLSATGMQYSVNSYAPTGMTGSPSMSFSNDLTSGLYYDTSENSIGVSHSSQKKMTVSPTGTNFYDSGILTGSMLSNGFKSPTQEVLILPKGTIQATATATETLYTPYITATHNVGFSAPVSGVITFPSDGVYMVQSYGEWLSNATGLRRLRVLPVSGTAIFNTNTTTVPTVSGSNHFINNCVMIVASANDQIGVYTLQTSGGNLVVQIAVSIARLF